MVSEVFFFKMLQKRSAKILPKIETVDELESSRFGTKLILRRRLLVTVEGGWGGGGGGVWGVWGGGGGTA